MSTTTRKSAFGITLGDDSAERRTALSSVHRAVMPNLWTSPHEPADERLDQTPTSASVALLLACAATRLCDAQREIDILRASNDRLMRWLIDTLRVKSNPTG